MTSPSDANPLPEIGFLKSWEGRTQIVSDAVHPAAVEAFRATFDDEVVPVRLGDPAPLGFHWCLALALAPTAALGEDGHPARGGFLPPVPLPRRMWAGGRIRFADDLRVGDAVTRTSRVMSVSLKEGRTGPLVFVIVEHEIATARGPALIEEHDIVFRGAERAGQAPAARPAPDPPAAVSRAIVPSPVLLFRYSALTFNGHRIHYDRPYATGVEGYPGLIVHGPLQATLLMRLGEELLGVPLAGFAFRAERPLYDLAPFTVEGGSGEGSPLRVRDADGFVTMSATATARPAG